MSSWFYSFRLGLNRKFNSCSREQWIHCGNKSDWKSVWIRDMEYLCNCKRLSQSAISCNQLIVTNQLVNWMDFIRNDHSFNGGYLVQSAIRAVWVTSFLSLQISKAYPAWVERWNANHTTCRRLALSHKDPYSGTFFDECHCTQRVIGNPLENDSGSNKFTDRLRRPTHNKLASIQANCQRCINQHRSLCLMVSQSWYKCRICRKQLIWNCHSSGNVI